MKSVLRGVALLSVGTWLFYSFYAAYLVGRLATFEPLTGRVIPFLLMPLFGLAASALVGFKSSPRLTPTSSLVIELVLLCAGIFFVIVVLAARLE